MSRSLALEVLRRLSGVEVRLAHLCDALGIEVADVPDWTPPTSAPPRDPETDTLPLALH